MSISTAGAYAFTCEAGADFVRVIYVPGNYSTATCYFHVRKGRSFTLIVAGTATPGSYDSGNDRTPITLTIADTVTDALTAPQTATYDVLTVLSGVSRYWLRGDFHIVPSISQPGVS